MRPGRAPAGRADDSQASETPHSPRTDLLEKLLHCVWTGIQAEVRRLLRRDVVVPGMVAAIQTHGELLHWHPHLHVLLTCGAFTATGDFLELSELNLERLEIVWHEAVFALYLAEEKIEPEVVEKMRTWQHSGFSVDQSVLLATGDQAGIERLVQYMIRCPFSLSRLVKISESGQVVYKAEKQARPAFPDQHGDGIQSGLKRNYQILPPLDFLAEFIQHIPATGPHLIRYDGWYSNKSRGMRKKAGEAAGSAEEFENSSATVGAEEASLSRSRQSWAMLIKRVYEVAPLSCPECGGAMAVVAFIEPPQRDVIEKSCAGTRVKPTTASRRCPSKACGRGRHRTQMVSSKSSIPLLPIGRSSIMLPQKLQAMDPPPRPLTILPQPATCRKVHQFVGRRVSIADKPLQCRHFFVTPRRSRQARLLGSGRRYLHVLVLRRSISRRRLSVGYPMRMLHPTSPHYPNTWRVDQGLQSLC